MKLICFPDEAKMLQELIHSRSLRAIVATLSDIAAQEAGDAYNTACETRNWNNCAVQLSELADRIEMLPLA